MNKYIEAAKELIGNKRDEVTAQLVLKLFAQMGQFETPFVLNTPYWISEWSWTPLADGYFAFEGKMAQANKCVIKDAKNPIYFYRTHPQNHRIYFPWDLYPTKIEALEMSDFKDSFVYNWPNAEEKFWQMVKYAHAVGSELFK